MDKTWNGDNDILDGWENEFMGQDLYSEDYVRKVVKKIVDAKVVNLDEWREKHDKADM